MGSLGTCIARDCFCGEEISTKAQDREETIAWGNVALLQGNLLKSQKWIPDVLSYTSSSLKKTILFHSLTSLTARLFNPVFIFTYQIQHIVLSYITFDSLDNCSPLLVFMSVNCLQM